MNTIRRNKVPCYNCEDRQPGCHGSCEKYKAFDEECRKKRSLRLGHNAQYDGYTAQKAFREGKAKEKR